MASLFRKDDLPFLDAMHPEGHFTCRPGRNAEDAGTLAFLLCTLFGNGQFAILAMHSDRCAKIKSPLFQPYPLHYNNGRIYIPIIRLTSHRQISNFLFDHFHLPLIVTIYSGFTVSTERQPIPFHHRITYFALYFAHFASSLHSYCIWLTISIAVALATAQSSALQNKNLFCVKFIDI